MGESAPAERLQPVREGDAPQRPAVVEGVFAHLRKPCREGKLFQRAAVPERPRPDFPQGGGEAHFLQRGAGEKGVFADFREPFG